MGGETLVLVENKAVEVEGSLWYKAGQPKNGANPLLGGPVRYKKKREIKGKKKSQIEEKLPRDTVVERVEDQKINNTCNNWGHCRPQRKE